MDKFQLFEYVRSLDDLGWDVSQQLWNNPELAGEERLAAELMKNVLRKNEFF